MDDERQTPPPRGHPAPRREANELIGYGVGIGAFGAAGALLLGAVCPICVVAAPALIGAGVYKRAACYLAERRAAALKDEPEPQA